MHAVWKQCILGLLLAGLAGCASSIDQASHRPVQACSSGNVIQQIRLDELNSLVVRHKNESHAVVVELVYGDEIVQSYTVSNGMAETDLIQAVHLDTSSADKEYLIRIPDRSSTYGAETGVIVYHLGWWAFLLIPDDQFRVEDIDGDGVAEIICERIQKQTFRFVHGVLYETRQRAVKTSQLGTDQNRPF